MPKYVYRIVAAELWGNAKDGFDTNNWHTIHTIERYKPFTKRWLLRVARDCFQGRSFAWSENSSRPMSRAGIDLSNVCNHYEVEYRGEYVGHIVEEVG